MTDFARLFGNAEWRLHPDLLLNAGALFERNNLAGEHLSPRAMLNWRVAEGHTLRYGVTEGVRPPSNYEKHANVRYYLGGVLADSVDVARGNVVAEKVRTQEIGYLAELPGHGLSLDLRLFEERVRGLVKRQAYDLPGSGFLNTSVFDYTNQEDFDIRGYEYQLKWQPWREGRVIYGQSALNSSQSVGNGTVGAYRSQSLMFMQHLPAGLDFSLVYSEADATHFPGLDQAAPATSRTDVRLAKALRLGGHRAELSAVVQNLGEPYQDFLPRFRFHQQAYVMLRLEN